MLLTNLLKRLQRRFLVILGGGSERMGDKGWVQAVDEI